MHPSASQILTSTAPSHSSALAGNAQRAARSYAQADVGPGHRRTRFIAVPLCAILAVLLIVAQSGCAVRGATADERTDISVMVSEHPNPLMRGTTGIGGVIGAAPLVPLSVPLYLALVGPRRISRHSFDFSGVLAVLPMVPTSALGGVAGTAVGYPLFGWWTFAEPAGQTPRPPPWTINPIETWFVWIDWVQPMAQARKPVPSRPGKKAAVAPPPREGSNEWSC